MIAYEHCTPYIQVEVKSIRSMSVCNRRRARRVELVRPRAGSNWSVGVDGCVCVCVCGGWRVAAAVDSDCAGGVSCV